MNKRQRKKRDARHVPTPSPVYSGTPLEDLSGDFYAGAAMFAPTPRDVYMAQIDEAQGHITVIDDIGAPPDPAAVESWYRDMAASNKGCIDRSGPRLPDAVVDAAVSMVREKPRFSVTAILDRDEDDNE